MCSFRRASGAVVLLFAMSQLTACSFVNMAVARAHSRDRFIPTASNPDVRYDTGSHEMAERISKALSHSRDVVELAHGAAFIDAPSVFVCGAQCFTTFIPHGKEVAAAQFANAVFMNEDLLLEQEQQRNMPVENFLTHELAHLLLYQHAGPLAYLRVPSWFREGIAVAVSNGAGAQACTPAEAARNILQGKNFDPAEAGSLFRDRTAPSYKLRPSIFYRQAGMFVQYLWEQNPAAFQTALKNVFSGADFQQSYERAYGRSISSQWPAFVATMDELAAQR